ncbi:hypothetical protein BAE44_0020464, partial [Dichanthelium oligosanthes]
LDRERIHRQNQFHKVYTKNDLEGQNDSAQQGFNVGFRQSVQVGYKWGLVRGVTSALVSLPDSSKENFLPMSSAGENCRIYTTVCWKFQQMTHFRCFMTPFVRIIIRQGKHV